MADQTKVETEAQPEAPPSDERKRSKSVYANLSALKSKHSIRWSACAGSGLDREIDRIVSAAVQRALSNGRKTLRAEDF